MAENFKLPATLHWSPRSPYVRKVMICLHETGLVDRVTLVRSVAAVTTPNPQLQRDNPLSKIPTLVFDDGEPLYDSVVICELLDTLHTGARLIPASGAERWHALRQQALADGLLDLLLVWRGELSRPPAQQSQPHLDAYANKVGASLDRLERDIELLTSRSFGIGHIATGCTLSYLDFRFPTLDWRRGHSRLQEWHTEFEQRPSVRATAVVDDS